MTCVKCRSDNTKCVDDMLQIGYVAEIYKCNDCNGTIEVVYDGNTIGREHIKEYRYVK